MDIGTIINWDWALNNILWEVLSTIFVVLFFIFLKVIPISIKLLRQNRDTRGNGYGTHFADRFVDIWYSSGKSLLRSDGNLYTFSNAKHSRYSIKVIDDQLCVWQLIEKDTSTGYDAVKPVRNWKNRSILFIAETWLVYVMGDNKNFYKELKKRVKKS